MDDGLFFLAAAVGIDVVALIFRLNGERAAQTKKALALELVEDESVTDGGDSDVSPEICFHVSFLHARGARRWRMKRRL